MPWEGGWQDENLTRHFRQAGLNAIRDASGTAALGNCLATDVVQTLFADIDWHNYNRQTEIKLVCADESKFGPVTRNLFYQLHSLPFLRFLEKVTGIPYVMDAYREEALAILDSQPAGSTASRVRSQAK